jgi:hypothetical protein
LDGPRDPSTVSMPQPKVGTRIRFVERRNHPQVLDGLICTRKAVSLVQADIALLEQHPFVDACGKVTDVTPQRPR